MECAPDMIGEVISIDILFSKAGFFQCESNLPKDLDTLNPVSFAIMIDGCISSLQANLRVKNNFIHSL